jgi:hypothetical protein
VAGKSGEEIDALSGMRGVWEAGEVLAYLNLLVDRSAIRQELAAPGACVWGEGGWGVGGLGWGLKEA